MSGNATGTRRNKKINDKPTSNFYISQQLWTARQQKILFCNRQSKNDMKQIKRTLIIFGLLILTSIFFSCNPDININDYMDKNSPLKLSIGNPLEHVDIAVNSDKYKKIVQWGNENLKDWKWTPASYIADISLSQGNFRLLVLSNNNGVVIGFTDKDGKSRQYTKSINKGELDFLIK